MADATSYDDGVSMWAYDPQRDLRADAKAAVEAERRRAYDPTLLMHPNTLAALAAAEDERPGVAAIALAKCRNCRGPMASVCPGCALRPVRLRHPGRVVWAGSCRSCGRSMASVCPECSALIY